MAVPEADRHKTGREKVAVLRKAARAALRRSARDSGMVLGDLEKNDAGAPLPSNGVHWSLTHKESYVAAVTSPVPIGIDIEKDRPCSEGLYQRIAGPAEWKLASQMTQRLFFRYWTAKEAVLKAVGQGMVGLSRCHIAKILDDTRMELTYDGSLWRVAQCWVARDHIVTVTVDDADIEWHLPD